MNKFLLCSMPLVAGAMAFGVLRVYSRAAERSPDTLMKGVEAELARAGGKKKPDYNKVLFDIEIAMSLARERGERAKEAEILKRRAGIFNSMGRSTQARDDYARLLAEFDPGDKETAVTLSQLEYYAGILEPGRARMEALLAEDPTYLLANRTHGEILIKQADQIVAGCEQLLQAVMDDEATDHAMRLSKWIAVRDEEDLQRASMLEEVNSRFPAFSEPERKLYNQLVHTAGTLYDNAYYDYEQALGVYTDLYVLVDLLDLLHRSGRTVDAIDFGLANRLWFLAFEEPSPIQTLATALHEGDRSTQAARLVDRFSVRKLKDEFLPTWLPIAYAAEDWKALASSGASLAAQHPSSLYPDANRSLALFYQGIGLSRTDPKQASPVLASFASDATRMDPFPGAFSIAEAARARSLIESGGAKRSQAAEPLMASLLLRESAAGDEWLELYDLVKNRRAQTDELELVLAHTMAALPDRADEFEPKWRQVAQARMDKTRLNLQALRQQASVGETGLPPLDVGSYALFALAETYASEESWNGVHAACKAVLELVPYFPPAVKLYVQACSNLARPSDAIDLLLGQLRFLGGNERVVARLEALRPRMSNAQFLEFMRLDPDDTGRNAMADALIERGRSDRALAALDGHIGDLDDEGLFHYGRALASNGREKEALLTLGRIPTSAPVYPRAFEVMLKTAIAAGDHEVLDTAISYLTLPNMPVGPELVSAVDQLLVARDLDTAQRISTYLDASAPTRSGQNLMRLAAVKMAKGDFGSARETLERALAFQSDGGPELGLVLIAILEGEPEPIARALAAAELSTSPTKTSTKAPADAVSQAALGLLAMRSEVATSLQARVASKVEPSGEELLLRACADVILGTSLQSVASLGPLDEEIQAETALFLTGTPASPRDPRLALGLLLALHHPDWRLWMLQELSDRTAEQCVLWPSYLTALALLRHGEYDRADAQIAALTERWPGFAPAWELAKELVRVQPLSAESLLQIAIDGWAAPPSPDAARARLSLARARELFTGGDLAGARTELQAGLRIAPTDAPLLYQSLRVLHAAGRFGEALEATKAFLAALPARARDAALPEVLDLFGETLAERRFPLETWQEFLTSLAQRYSENSLVVLQLASLDVRTSVASNPVTGVYRAFERLNTFRKSINNAPVESLGTGALARWHEFYLETSPERGEAFLRDELEADPRSSDLWAMLGENLLAQGRCKEAREELDLLLSIVPDERALELWIEIEANRGSPIEDLMRACTMLTSLRGLEKPDDRIRYLQAISNLGDLRGGDPRLGMEILEELWQRSSELGLELKTKVGRALGVALMSRGSQGDDRKAQAVFAALVELPLRRDQRRLYGTLALVGPAPAKAQQVLPKRELPARIPTIAADGSVAPDRATVDEPAKVRDQGRQSKGKGGRKSGQKKGGQKKGGPAAEKGRSAEQKARFESLSPEEQDAYRARQKASKDKGSKKPGSQGHGRSSADTARFESMSPAEREAYRAKQGASTNAPRKEPDTEGAEKPGAAEKPSFESMSPAEREAYRAKQGASKNAPRKEPDTEGAEKPGAAEKPSFESMSPAEREAYRAKQGASKDAGRKKPDVQGGGKNAMDREAYEAMTPEEREAFRQKQKQEAAKKKGSGGG